MTVTLRFDPKNVEIILCTVKREIELKVKNRCRVEISAVDNNQDFVMRGRKIMLCMSNTSLGHHYKLYVLCVIFTVIFYSTDGDSLLADHK